jgi:outer membrane protein
MKRVKTRLAAHLVLVLSGLTPIGAHALDLLGAYVAARDHDPVFEATRHASAASAERIVQARAGLLPELRLTGNSKRTSGDVSFDDTPEVHRKIRSHDLRLELVQPIYRGQNWAAYGQARLQAEQAEAQLLQARQELILRVAQAYFDVLSAQDTLAAAQSQKNAVAAQLELVTRGFKAGNNTVTDVHEARSRFDLASAQAIAAENDLEVRRSSLEQLVGSAPPRLAALRADARPPAPAPQDVKAWTDVSRERSPAVTVQRMAVAIAEREVSRARAGHQPTLDLVASSGRDYASGSLTSPTSIETRSESNSYALQLNLPLFAGGATGARVAEARLLEHKARAELEAARRAAAHGARQAYAGVVNGLSQLTAMEQAVNSSRSAVQGNQLGYRVGTRLNVDVLNAEQQLYVAQRDLARARYETLLQGLRLKAAAGQLGEEDIGAVNSLLEGG